MQIEIPLSWETIVKERAAAAGFGDVGDYVLGLIQADTFSPSRLDELANDPRLEQLALQGVGSGPAEPLDMEAIRRAVLRTAI